VTTATPDFALLNFGVNLIPAKALADEVTNGVQLLASDMIKLK
jgi:hypothetical protein